MKTLILVISLMMSFMAHADDKAACIVKYDYLSDDSDAIFYYEVSKYDSQAQEFKTLKQWYCDGDNVEVELPKMVKENCSLINIDKVTINPNADGSFDMGFGCG